VPTVPARSRRRRASGARDAVLTATHELLAERRLEDLQVNEIVDRARISRQTFYLHFDSKYSVVAALIADMGDGILDVWNPLFSGDGPILEQQVRELGVETIARWRAEAPLFTATIEGWHRDPEIHDVWSDVLNRFTDGFTPRVSRHRGAEGLRSDDDMLIAALISVFERCLYLAISAPRSPLGRSDGALAGMLAKLWVDALNG
jgi:AcrR family transcriptional regulator